MAILRFRALEARVLPFRDVEEDEVFQIDTDGPYGAWGLGLFDQIDALIEQGHKPWLEDLNPPSLRPAREAPAKKAAKRVAKKTAAKAVVQPVDSEKKD